MKLRDFARTEWEPNALLVLKKRSVWQYRFHLDRYALPVLGQTQLCDLSRAGIQACLSDLRRSGGTSAKLRRVRAAISTVLQAAVDREYLEKNPAHGIRLRETEAKKARRFYSPTQARKLLRALPEPYRTIVLLAVLTGMRIGEILALRWKRVDLLRGVIEVAETFSDGEFGTPKTRSSNRVIPISSILGSVFEAHRKRSPQSGAEDLLFVTPRRGKRGGSPMNAKNLYNRVLAPACDAIGEPRVSWHSFRHTHATLLGEDGESVRTAQAILGHSDLETTQTYMHAIPGSQRRAVEGIGKRFVGLAQDNLFPDVLDSVGLKFENNPEGDKVN